METQSLEMNDVISERYLQLTNNNKCNQCETQDTLLLSKLFSFIWQTVFFRSCNEKEWPKVTRRPVWGRDVGGCHTAKGKCELCFIKSRKHVSRLNLWLHLCWWVVEAWHLPTVYDVRRPHQVRVLLWEV